MTALQNARRHFAGIIQYHVRPQGTTTTRSFSSMLLRLERRDEVTLAGRNESFMWKLQGKQQNRSMVLVTKSKASELSSDVNGEETSSNSAYDAANHKVLSEELVITPSCLARVEKLVQQRKLKDGGDYFLRVFVDAGGCSGFQYQFEFDQEYDSEEDIILVTSSTDDKPRIVVDQTSLGFLRGSKLDFVQEMIKSSFAVVDNPQSESACGCGSSFAVKNFASNPALD